MIHDTKEGNGSDEEEIRLVSAGQQYELVGTSQESQFNTLFSPENRVMKQDLIEILTRL